MLDGEEWKQRGSGKEPLKPHQARHYCDQQTRLLMDIVGGNNIMETHIVETSPDGEHCKIMCGNSFMTSAHWLRTSDCYVLATLPERNLGRVTRKGLGRNIVRPNDDE